jgi:hypothetical protein
MSVGRVFHPLWTKNDLAVNVDGKRENPVDDIIVTGIVG